MTDQVVSFIFKAVVIVAIITVSVMFTLALEKKQRDQHEKGYGKPERRRK